MISYKKTQMDPNGRGNTAGKWFIKPVIRETLGVDELAKHMAQHNTPYSAGAIKGMLTDMIDCMKELMLDGKNVKLDDLAIFSIGIECTGATSRENLTVKDNVKSVKFRARATGEMTNKQLNLEATLKEIDEYTTDTNEAA